MGVVIKILKKGRGGSTLNYNDWKFCNRSFTRIMALSKPQYKIFFNCKTKKYPDYFFSNFYGGVEEHYQAKKFRNRLVRKFVKNIKNLTLEEFLELMKLLEKNGQYWTKKDEKGQRFPILGIAAKIIANLLKNGKQRKNATIIKKLTNLIGVTEDEFFQRNSDFKDEEYLAHCMRKKFKLEFFRKLLVKTGNKALHERPMRGSGDKWTRDQKGRGGNKMGEILVKIRTEIIKESNTKQI